MSASTPGRVSSEVLQDHFLDVIGTDLFSEENDGCQEEPDEEKMVSVFHATPPTGDTSVTKPFDITIRHLRSTTVSLVGLQVWRGALLLSDFILAEADHFNSKRTVVELAAGTGIASIVAATMVPVVVGTDVDRGDILNMMSDNFVANEDLIGRADWRVEEVDFFKTDWRERWRETAFDSCVDVILAADVVYDRDITDGFFSSLEYLLGASSSHGVAAYVAVERRTTDVDPETKKRASPNFDHFRRLLGDLGRRFRVDELPLDFHQFFRDAYERVDDLHLWRISIL